MAVLTTAPIKIHLFILLPVLVAKLLILLVRLIILTGLLTDMLMVKVLLLAAELL